jgi:thiamine-phosphate pyrophosphorylase
MTADIYLIAPPDAEAKSFTQLMDSALIQAEPAAVLLQRGTRGENAYKDFVRFVAPKLQAAGAAVLIEGDAGLVRMLGADGLHVSGSISAVRAAIAALKPDFIVGAGDIHTRDDAMGKGETGVDYILFGPLSGPIPATERDLARWWAETMEVPCVLSDPMATLADFDAAGCDFVGLSTRALEPAR